MYKRLFLLIMGLLCSITACIAETESDVLADPVVSLIRLDSNLILQDPVWSPTGDYLVVTGIERCHYCDTGIYKLELNGELNPLFSSDKERSRPSWTSYPNLISFTQRDEPSGIYIAKLDGQALAFLTEGERASWSSNGQYVAVARMSKRLNISESTRASVFILNLITNQEQKVYETPESTLEFISGLAWSPDNRRLAFSATWLMPDNGSQSGIYIVNADGTGLEQIADMGGGPGWLPEQNWLYYISEGSLVFSSLEYPCIVSPLEIIGINAAAISPMGDQIAFEYKDGIYLLDLDHVLGGAREKLSCSD